MLFMHENIIINILYARNMTNKEGKEKEEEELIEKKMVSERGK